MPLSIFTGIGEKIFNGIGNGNIYKIENTKGIDRTGIENLREQTSQLFQPYLTNINENISDE